MVLYNYFLEVGSYFSEVLSVYENQLARARPRRHSCALTSRLSPTPRARISRYMQLKEADTPPTRTVGTSGTQTSRTSSTRRSATPFPRSGASSPSTRRHTAKSKKKLHGTSICMGAPSATSVATQVAVIASDRTERTESSGRFIPPRSSQAKQKLLVLGTDH
jgi:hypothetical protein